MNESLKLALCELQGQLFQSAGEKGYDSEVFIRVFMTSDVAKDLDMKFNHLQWAGAAYIMSEMEENYAAELTQSGDVYDAETLYWMGYIYRYWHFYTDESSKDIYTQAPAKTMRVVYLMYHTMSPELAIDRLKESYNEKHGKI